MAVAQERTEHKIKTKSKLKLSPAQFTCSVHMEHFLISFPSVRLV